MTNGAEGVIRQIENDSVSWLAFQFTDLLGSFKQVLMSAKLLASEGLENIVGRFDGSSVKGFAPVEDSDLILKPDPNTYALIPWSKGVARFICDVYGASSRLSKDPRYVAQKADKWLESQGYRAYASAELEFFIFDRARVEIDAWRQSYELYSSESLASSTPPFNRPKEGYYASYPRDKHEELKIEIGDTLARYFGLEVQVLHHEVAAPSQHEITFKGGSAEFLGDAVQTAKFVVKALAHRRGAVATFMPKPIYGDNGSGMHIHISIWRGSENVFHDSSDEYAGLSQFARYFIGGLIEHGRALSAIVSPTTNSYKRLVPGYEAPIYLIWGKGNRSAAIRIPSNSRYNGLSTRIEYRPPDPSANPYLAIAAVIMAGFDGVRKKIDPGDPIGENVYKMPVERRKALGIKELPRSLSEALDELECDNEWLKPVFSEDLIKTYIELKRAEAEKMSSYPSPIEVYSYIDV